MPDFAAQVRQAYANLRTALDDVDARPGQVVKLTIHVVDHDPSKLGVLIRAIVDTFGAAKSEIGMVRPQVQRHDHLEGAR